MGQKVHPVGFRLGITQKHQSYWCTTPEKSALWIEDASFLRNYLSKTYLGAGITHIEIEILARQATKHSRRFKFKQTPAQSPAVSQRAQIRLPS